MAKIKVGSTFTNGVAIESVDGTASKAATLLNEAKAYADLKISVGNGEGITSGSNSNGQWLRFPNGTQICWNSQNHGSQPVSSAWGVLYGRARNSSYIDPFPSSFISPPTVLKNITAGGDSTIIQATIQKPTTSHPGGFEAVRATSATVVDFTTHYIAIGRWK